MHHYTSIQPGSIKVFVGDVFMSCARKADGRWAVGISYDEDLRISDANAQDNVSRYFNHQCVYPPSPVLSTIVCPLWMSGTVTGPEGNPTVSSSTLLNTGRIPSVFAKSGQKNPNACGQSWTLTAKANMTALGKYRATVNGQVARCTRRDYPGSSQAPDIKSCSPQPVQTWNFKGSVWCNGYSTTTWASGHSWTMDECLNQGVGAAQCVRATWPTYAGISASSPISVFHDGKTRAATFPALKLSGGVRNVKAKSTSYSAAGSPMWDGLGVNSANQPYTSSVKFGTALSGDVKGFNLSFQAAGKPGANFTVTKKTKFTAEFKRQTIQVNSLDLRTGAMNMSSATIWVPDEGTCASLPLSLMVTRARNSN